MSEYRFAERAYVKMIFHAAKYPSFAVNGILLADKTSKDIVDAIPLFHQCPYVSPMAEIALMQIDAYAEREGLIMAGYYAAAENFLDNSIEKAPASKIGDKVQENYKQACFVVIDNSLMTHLQEEPAIKVYACSGDNGRWSKADYYLLDSELTLLAVSALLQRGVAKELIDFDNHLDNPENDWTNTFLNRNLDQIMSMY